jgi:hypothetical protein
VNDGFIWRNPGELSQIQKENHMNIHQLIIKFAAGLVLAGALALSLPTASFAFGGHEYYYEPSDNGSVWSYYPGYFSHGPADATTDIPADAHAMAPAVANPTHARTPAGSSHECWISSERDQAPGMGYWGSCSTLGASPMK